MVGKFVYRLYEEKDSFPFFIVKMSHFDSNIYLMISFIQPLLLYETKFVHETCFMFD